MENRRVKTFLDMSKNDMSILDEVIKWHIPVSFFENICNI